MGLFNRLFGKKEELIYEGENLYQKIKAEAQGIINWFRSIYTP